MSHSNRPRSLGAAEWLLVIFIVSVIVLIGALANLGGNLSAGPIIATSTWTPTPTSTATPTSTPTLLPTDTATPTNTPTTTATPTLPPRPSTGILATIEITAGLIISGTPVPTPAAVVDLPSGTINILLLGTDQRPGDTSWRTDSMIVVSVNPKQNYVTMLSLPRDLWVYLPGTDRFARLNTADYFGRNFKTPGSDATFVEQTLLYNLGIPIDYFARVNFAGVKQIIDKLGGVDVLAQCPLYDVFPDVPDNQSDIITDPAQLSTVPTGTIDIPTPGLYTLDGKHALWFARSRYSTNDFDRSRRQQMVLRAVWSKIKQQGLITQLPNLWGDLTQLVQTDLSLNDVIYLASFASKLDDSQIKLRAVDSLVTQSFLADNGAQVLLIQPDRMELVLQEAFEPPLSNVAAQASAKVEVWNGSGNANWDLLGVERLTSQGFIVPNYGPADQTYPKTTIVNFGTTAKGSRIGQLMRLFNVKSDQVINQPDPNSPVNYRVIVGSDFNSCQPPAPPVDFPPTPTPTPPVIETPTP